MKASVARKYGWRPIVSEAQATVLMRRELKRLRSQYQRRHSKKAWPVHSWPQGVYDFSKVLNIKVGSWYKFIANYHGRPILSLLCDVEDDEVPCLPET